MNLNALIAEAAALGGANICAAGHRWQSVGGRSCPHQQSDFMFAGCSQTVYECAQCGATDYGYSGGPAYEECATTCKFGQRDKFWH